MISRRSIEATEQQVTGRTLAGYAAVYGQDSREIVENGRRFTERIAPGASASMSTSRAAARTSSSSRAWTPT